MTYNQVHYCRVNSLAGFTQRGIQKSLYSWMLQSPASMHYNNVVSPVYWFQLNSNKSVQYHGILNTVSHVPDVEALSVIETL